MDNNRSHIREHIEDMPIPVDIKASILYDKTSIGKNKAMPEIYETPYLEKILKPEYESAVGMLNGLGDFDIEDISEVLAKSLKRCIELEKPYRNQLERICMNYAIEFFGIPEGSIDISLSLKDSVSAAEAGIRMDPVSGSEPEYMDIANAYDIEMEISKRKFINALCIGAGMRLSMRYEKFSDTINAINPELIPLYKRIVALNYFLNLIDGRITPTDDNDLQIGTVVVNIGNDMTKTLIDANAVIFPVLLSELVAGLMEFFASHGLPKDRAVTAYVLKNTDYLKSEPWNMRIGPALWSRIEKSLNYVKSTELPYLFKKITELKYEKFNELMNEVLLGTKRGKQMMQTLLSLARRDMEYDEFANRMDMRRNDIGIITDEHTYQEDIQHAEG